MVVHWSLKSGYSALVIRDQPDLEREILKLTGAKNRCLSGHELQIHVPDRELPGLLLVCKRTGVTPNHI